VYINEEKTLFGDQNFVSGDLFTGASRHKATWEKIQLGALKWPTVSPLLTTLMANLSKQLLNSLLQASLSPLDGFQISL